MSNLTHLLAEVRKSARSPQKAQPYDGFSKADLWERLQAAEGALQDASHAAQSAGTQAHNYAQGSTGEARRQFIALRDAAYKARDAATVVHS